MKFHFLEAVAVGIQLVRCLPTLTLRFVVGPHLPLRKFAQWTTMYLSEAALKRSVAVFRPPSGVENMSYMVGTMTSI